MRRFFAYNKLILATGLLMLSVVMAQTAAAKNRNVDIYVTNCVPGTTFYPQLTAIHMEGLPSMKPVPGPPAGAKLGTCGPKTQLTHHYSDAGGATSDAISGIVVISGLNGGSLLYYEAQEFSQHLYYPDKSTSIPGIYHAYWQHNMVMSFIANHATNTLPGGVSCPSGYTQEGRACMRQSVDDPYYISFDVQIYPPAGGVSQRDYLPNLPSTN